ncbi:MAG: EamA family transporter [Bacteroidota bacterium]
MGATYLLLSIAFSVGLAQCLKIAERPSVRVVPVLVVNYAAATVLGWFSGSQIPTALPVVPVIMGVILGILFIINLYIYGKTIQINGMGIGIAAMRLSLVVPILVSLIWFGESITTLQSIGIIVALSALFLMIPAFSPKTEIDLKQVGYPIALFVVSGGIDGSLKIFQELYAHQLEESYFLSVIFFCAFICGVLHLIFKKQFHFRWRELVLGVGTGIVNYGSTYYLLRSLTHVSGSVVFPVVNVSVVVAGTAIGYLVWKDHVRSRQWLGLCSATIALILLLL